MLILYAAIGAAFSAWMTARSRHDFETWAEIIAFALLMAVAWPIYLAVVIRDETRR